LIKYLGSKRALLPVIGAIAQAIGAKTALDLFSGTTRVAQEFKRQGIQVSAVDCATYSHILAQTFIACDATTVSLPELQEALAQLMSLPGKRAYFTKTFCEASRFFQVKNGMKIDAIRDEIERCFTGSPLYPILLTSLMLAADRVDSTVGVQMAYLKQWAPRSYRDIELTAPTLIPGTGTAVLGDALTQAEALGHFDLAYLDPPYNQHRYFTNYHIWETLMRWDAPAYYGKACKRIDARDTEGRSPFNSRKTMPAALRASIEATDAEVMVVSLNNEAWVTAETIQSWLTDSYGEVAVFNFEHKRYVGAQIGIYDTQGTKVGAPGQLRNVEHLVVAGPARHLRAIRSALST
jgi:adenine-specific DNA-methyltransferase